MLLFLLSDMEFSPSLRAEELAFPSQIFREAWSHSQLHGQNGQVPFS